MIKTALKHDPLLVFLAPLLLVIGGGVKWVLGMDPLAVGEPVGWLWLTAQLPLWANYVMTIVLGLFTAFFINQLTQNLGLLGRITNTTMLVFVIFFFALPDGYHLALGWFIAMLQLQVIKWVEDMYDQPAQASYLAFNASLLIGIIGLFIDAGLLLFFIVIQALAISGVGSLKRVIIGLLGLALPTYLVNAVLYLLGSPFHWPTVTVELSMLSGPLAKSDVLGMAMLAFMVITSVVSVVGISSSTTLRERRRWMLVIGYFVIAALLVLNAGWTEVVFIFIIPSTMILTRVFLLVQRRKVVNAILLIFLALVLLINS